MGNNPSTKSANKLAYQQYQQGQQMMGCQDDLMCKNIDAKRSTPGNLVLVCPNATCLEGVCDCGVGCERDTYTGICCSKVEKDANGNSYCIEDEYKEEVNPKYKECKVPDQEINGKMVSGQYICDLYTRYQQ